MRSLNDIGADSVSRHALRARASRPQENITEISEKRPLRRSNGMSFAELTLVTEAEYVPCRPVPDYGTEHGGYPRQERRRAARRLRTWWLIAAAALCALIAGAFWSGFRNCAASDRRPEKGITEIANHNYRQRLDFSAPRIRIGSRVVQQIRLPNSTNTAAVRLTT